MKRVSFLVFTLLFITGLVQSQSVSEWREEERTGVSSEKGLRKSWPDGGPQLLWSNTDLPGGYSSVSFGNDLIYLTGLDGQNDIWLLSMIMVK